MKTGDALGPWRLDPVAPEPMAVIAEVLADPNPIHLDAEAVKAAGLGERQINQGPSNLAYVLNMLAEAAPGAEIAELDIRFTANVFAGDAVEATGEVGEIDGDGRATCAVRLVKADGAPAIVGTAVLGVRQWT